MSKISINSCAVYLANAHESKRVELNPEKTKNCYAACLATLDRLGILKRFVEVIRVAFIQKDASGLTAEFVLVFADPFGGSKFEIRADFPCGSVHVFAEESVSYTLCYKARERLKERFSQAEDTMMRIKEDIEKM